MPKEPTPAAAAADERIESEPARILEWIDDALNELEGSLAAARPHIDAGRIDPNLVSAKINGLFLRVMQAASAPAPGSSPDTVAEPEAPA